MTQASIGVVGAGAWGTALAQSLASDGRTVKLWALEDGLADAINTSHRNLPYLPSAELAPTIAATGDLSEMAACDILLLVTPAQHMGPTLEKLGSYPRDLVLCSKGIEASTGRMMHHAAHDIAPESDLAVLSGPTFAHEVADGLPCAVTLACGGGEDQWDRISPAIARHNFRPYYSDDVVGAEVGGAVKNVLAIACGVVDGLELGQNARNALITRGFAEMLRFGVAFGGKPETLNGLCGLGDLVLTCSSTSSRNFSLGKALGEGMSAEEALADKRTVAEGAHTAPVLRQIARDKGVQMPIVEAVNHLLEGRGAREVVAELLSRPLKAEGHEA
ncbi:NAD(P)H-dependent glycerol-3-phosphate dehydrogenase [Aurantiacibacter sp. MUD61]|uniref:NAD(P)H-dependent glycerol-3-phosphate dehydrogenase n=1 Tax=Aurantiacibacter sp. MUD61 TaxID=3009083 RepID=UPI0022F0C1FC|nr:NAD(P)H-dependent glycerol-3-phosphate dehydrogenase [Aurantiacibacter sp. MUD61]